MDRLVPLLLRLMRIDRRGLDQLALGVHHRDLDAGTKARVQRQRGALPGRRRQQQVAHVFGEDANGAFLRRLP